MLVEHGITLFCAKVLIGSRVVQGSRRIPGVHHFSLATVDTDSVVTWTRRHVGPLTSLSEPQMSRTITLPIGQRGMYIRYVTLLLSSVNSLSSCYRFYCAMLCKRGLCCHAVSVCLSVRQSVTFVDHVKTNKHIYEIFSPSGSDTILVFPYQRGCRYSDGNPPNGGVECKGYDKMTIFSQISRSISETVIVRWAHAARQFVSMEFSFHPYNI